MNGFLRVYVHLIQRCKDSFSFKTLSHCILLSIHSTWPLLLPRPLERSFQFVSVCISLPSLSFFLNKREHSFLYASPISPSLTWILSPPSCSGTLFLQSSSLFMSISSFTSVYVLTKSYFVLFRK